MTENPDMLKPSPRCRWAALLLGLAGFLAPGCTPSPSTTAPEARGTPTTPKPSPTTKPQVDKG
jgi:hypothetical protein